MAQGYRRQFLERLQSGDRLEESEILNMILSNAYGGRDMSAVAGALLERFPSISALLKADYVEITAVKGVSESVATYLKSLDLARKTFSRGDLYINGAAQCFEVAAERIGGKASEIVEMYFVNKSGKVTGIKTHTSDLPDRVEISAGTLLQEISASNAFGLYVAHNHINVSATPSGDDDKVTARIIKACEICKIVFFDHCIVSSNGETFSYRESGRAGLLKE